LKLSKHNFGLSRREKEFSGLGWGIDNVIIRLQVMGELFAVRASLFIELFLLTVIA